MSLFKSYSCTPCTVAAEAVRPSSGPPLPSGVSARYDEVSPSFSLEIARTALLELRKSVTSADVTNVNAVDSGPVTPERPDESTSLSTTSSVVSDGEMDTTSSDGGSTVRELNEQLMSGNTGNGIDESSMSGSMDSILMLMLSGIL